MLDKLPLLMTFLFIFIKLVLIFFNYMYSVTGIIFFSLPFEI